MFDCEMASKVNDVFVSNIFSLLFFSFALTCFARLVQAAMEKNDCTLVKDGK